MSIISIRPHSIVDLITNSSSELYIIEGKKTISMIKAILTNIVKLYDRANGTEYAKELFTTVFKEPVLVKWFFDEEKHSVLVALIRNATCLSYDSEEETFNEEFHQLRQLEISLLREYAPATGLTGEEVDVARHASRQAVSDRLRPHAERYFAPLIELEKLLLRHFAEDNGLTTEQVNYVLGRTLCYCTSTYYPGLRFRAPREEEDTQVEEFMDEYLTYKSYHISSKKGDIHLESASDNSVPWMLNETIVNMLSARRYHLS